MKTKKSIAVYLFDYNFNVVHEFDSKNEALNFLGIDKVKLNAAIRNKFTPCKGYLIKTDKSFYDPEIKVKSEINNMPYFKKPETKEKVMTYKDYLKQGVKTKQFSKEEGKDSYRRAKSRYLFKSEAFTI